MITSRKSSFRYGEIKSFQDKLGSKDFINTRPALKKMLKGSLLLESKFKSTQNLE